MSKFCPYYPVPHKNKSSFIFRFFRGWNSWIDVLFEKSYSMKMGHYRQAGIDVYMVNDPETVKKILVDEPDKYPKHHFMHAMLEDLLGDSIFTTNGKVWRHQRDIVNHGFLNSKLNMVFPAMSNSVNSLIEKLKTFNNKIIDIDPEITHVTADIIFKVILSENLSDKDAYEIYNKFAQYQDLIQKIMILRLYKLPISFYKKNSKSLALRVRSFISDAVDKRLALKLAGKNLPNDILTAICESPDNEGTFFTRDELVDQICTLFLAGHETSAAALSWSIYLIANDQEIQDNIYKEIMLNCPNEIALNDISKLNYINNVFRESLRLFPPVSFFMREATEDHILYDKFVKKGSLIVVSPWLLQRHRKQWNKPDEFNPNRFSDDDIVTKKTISQCYMPFSKGQRVCPGAGFAIQEAVLVLAMIVKTFKIEPDKNHIPIPSGKITLRTKNNIRVRFIQR